MVYPSNNIGKLPSGEQVNNVTPREPAGSLPINTPTGLECQGTRFYIPARSPLAILLSPAASPAWPERDLLAKEANTIVDVQPLTPFLGIVMSCSS
jgi:hypothetical protein